MRMLRIMRREQEFDTSLGTVDVADERERRETEKRAVSFLPRESG